MNNNSNNSHSNNQNYLTNLPPITSKKTAAALDEKMKQLQLARKEEEVKKTASLLGLNYINLADLPIEPEALRELTEVEARAAQAICFWKDNQELRLAVREPQAPSLASLIARLKEKHPRLQIILYLVSQYSLAKALERYKSLPQIIPSQTGVSISEGDLKQFSGIKSIHELQHYVQRVNVTEIVSLILAAAIDTQASDIHIEAGEQAVNIRFRIDGVLHQAVEISKDYWKKIIARIKLLSKLKLNVEDRPQDGHFVIHLKADRVDVRVSTLPTTFGESVVMRLLRSKSQGLAFDDLGLLGAVKEKLEREVSRPNGMILVCGPTGAGKTTTIYAILTKLNTGETKIITIEDPIEYELPNISQSQIDPKHNYTFAKGLRSLVRQDPDIIMVGEIRDVETLDISLNAALTGHLVLSSLHTNNAAGVIPRMLAMGAKPYLVAPAINAVMAQRLVRRICSSCRQIVQLSVEIRDKAVKALEQVPTEYLQGVDLKNLQWYRGQGCNECGGIGYRGRIGIFELFVIDSQLEKLILAGDLSEYKVKELALAQGMVTMFQDGLIKAAQGITSVEEVIRVIGVDL